MNIDLNNVESRHKLRGSLIIICGSMCSGKTEEIIRIISRQMIVHKNNVQTFKPLIDTRILKTNQKDPAYFITSRNGSFLPCIGVHKVREISEYLEKNPEISTIAIDEAHFFEKVK